MRLSPCTSAANVKMSNRAYDRLIEMVRAQKPDIVMAVETDAKWIAALKDALGDLERLMPHCAGIRRAGAAALDFASVAAGRLDGYWERNLGPWDIAAGLLLAQEAGAEVHALWQDQSILSSGSFVVATPATARQLRDAII